MFDLTFVIIAVCESVIACEFWGPGSSRFCAAYVLLASQNPNPSIAYLLAYYRQSLTLFWLYRDNLSTANHPCLNPYIPQFLTSKILKM